MTVSSTLSPNPTILIVHGGWHSPAHFARLRAHLTSAGFPSVSPALPSCNSGSPLTTTMYDDAAVVRAELERLVSREGKDVVVMAHSYGGLVTTEAAHAELGKAERRRRGLAGGIVRLVYLCATLVGEVGASIMTLGGGEKGSDRFPDTMSVDDEGYIHLLDPSPLLYQDLPQSEQDLWASQLKPMAAVAHTSGVNNLCHNFHPLSYVYCLDDKMFPLELQKALVAASGVAHVDEHHISSGHSPFLSQPEKVVEIIQEMVATDEKSRENDQEQTLK